MFFLLLRYVRKNCPAPAKNEPKAGEVAKYLGGEDPLEKETTTHSSILAWEIPQTEKPGRLQIMGSQLDTTV